MPLISLARSGRWGLSGRQTWRDVVRPAYVTSSRVHFQTISGVKGLVFQDVMPAYKVEEELSLTRLLIKRLVEIMLLRRCLLSPLSQILLQRVDFVGLQKVCIQQVVFRSAQPCVCKWFKAGHVTEASFFDLDIKAMDKAHDLVKEWNNRNMISQVVQVNIPQVWAGSAGYLQGKRLLQEPFIENYQKFNSNTGWADTDTPWPRVMQALSRFSYHVSGGQFVLCDLQGGVYSDTVVLTDPVIVSRSKQYGVTDLGPLGISSFFSNHVCNEFCRANWSRPADQRRYHLPQPGTSMAMARG